MPAEIPSVPAAGRTGGGLPARMAQLPADPRAFAVMCKLPQVTALFWVLKIVAVTLGETAGDLFGITLGVGYAATGLIFLGYFLVVLALQLRAPRFRPALFWAVVLGTSMVGTEVSDLLDRGPGHGAAADGIGYGWGALLLSALLGLVFLAWWRTGQSRDVEAISSRTGEMLYWAAILVSNTLGTASGDWLSDDTGLGFRNAFLIIAAVLLALVAAHYLTGISTTLLFWAAFVLTRPLGAAGGDALIKPVGQGGLGWGSLWGSAALLAVLLVLVACQGRLVRRVPLPPLPFPVDRRTGRPQAPNGAVVPRPAGDPVYADAV
ncbi:COG4705 family protein [Actinomadura rupiterrae]|uniref:COG4705 family protein n=1 Tax=Actinomadura rupiterrae TaxID=559627 RepID=UPI0020A5FF7E|nr:hypothetical protein [Actinomadura rupiterrae]MCP2342602.1 putative membrane-anchored protein [Actinomadura rupiterrae]